ncbi:MAG: phosphate ABC transporter substrate-binding protein PstS [Gemmataceae bacterium]
MVQKRARLLMGIATLLLVAGLIAWLLEVFPSGHPPLQAGGSTFVAPLMERWIQHYPGGNGAALRYQPSGSGAGVDQMVDQHFDIGCTDFPMTESQLKSARAAQGEVLHIPLVLGAVVPIYNVGGIKQPVRFTGPVLADIFLGKISRWNDPALIELNPDVKFPDEKIVVVHRSDVSGTSHIFADYLNKVSPVWREKVGSTGNWPVGLGREGNEGVADTVENTPGSIGYVQLNYAMTHKIEHGLVKNDYGEFIDANQKSVTAAAANALDDAIPEDLRYSITNAGGKGSYPIVGTVWAVVYLNQPSDKLHAVHAFLRWATHEGQEQAAGLHYAPLPPGLVEKVDRKLAKLKATTKNAS